MVLAAVFGAAASFIATSLKASRDERGKLCEGYADALLAAANDASEYWLTPHSAENIRLLEVKLVGKQVYLDRYRLLAEEWFSERDKRALLGSINDLYDSLTGGNFRGAAREMDPERAISCQVLAAQVAALVRASSMRSMSLRAHLARLILWPQVSRFFGNTFRWKAE